MRIAFISDYDFDNPAVRSGVPYHIAQAMKNNGAIVKKIYVKDKRFLAARIMSRLGQFYFALIKRKRYDASVSVATAKAYAQQVDNSLLTEIDFIFSISPKLVAFLETNKPIILWLDNSFLSFTLYPGMQDLSALTYKEALYVEKQAFQNCSHLFVVSSWLKEQILGQYDFLKTKVSVLPRGANIPQRFTRQKIEEEVGNKIKQPLKLLHINSGWWERKGGDLTVSIWEKLRESIDVGLTIVGSVPNDKKSILEDKGVVLVGNIDKSQTNGLLLFGSVMASSHFLLVPSTADGFGIIYAEAANFGVPSVAFGIMGVTEAIQQNITGIHLPAKSGADDFASAILQIWKNKDYYTSLSLSSYDFGAKKFDWHTNVQVIIDKIDVRQ